MKHWYALYTKPKQERQVDALLKGQGIETYLPTVRRKVRRRERPDRAVDGVLLILRAGQTRRQDAQAAVQSLRQVEANLVGVVLNAVPMVRGSHYTYYREEAITARPPRRRLVQRLVSRLADSLRNTVIEPAYQRYLGQQ